MRRSLPAVAVGVTLLAVWPPWQSAFHEPKRWLFVLAAGVGAVLTLPRWRWTALPLVALTALQPWRSSEAGLQAMAFAWALAAWPALQPDFRQFTRIVSWAAAVVGVVVVLQAFGVDVLGFAKPDASGRLDVYGTLGNPDFVASVLLPIALLSFPMPSPLSPSPRGGEGRGEGITRLLFIVPALIATRSFATLLSALVAGMVLIIHRRNALSPTLSPSGRGRQLVGQLRQVGAVLALCGLLCVGLIERDLGQAIAGRRYLVSVALPHVADAPLLGHGLGSTVLAWPTWELSYWQARCPDAACVAADPQRTFAALQDHVHSDWLEWLLERGILGLLALLLALGASLITLWRRDDVESSFLLAAMSAMLVRALVDFPLHRPADLCLLAALAAFAQVSPSSHSPSGPR